MQGVISRLFLIRQDELSRVGYFLMLFTLLGVGLALGRGTADALFFKRYGIEYLPVIYTVLSLVLALSSLGYMTVADRIASERLLLILFAGLVILVSLAWYAIAIDASAEVFPAYYLLYEVGSELLLLHVALYVGQNFETLQSKRLTPVIFAGLQVGKIIGGLLLAVISYRIGVSNVLLVWVVIATASLLLVFAWHRRVGISPYYRRVRRSRGIARQATAQVTQALGFLRASPLVKASYFSLFFMVLSYYILAYAVNRVYTEHFPSEAGLGQFFGYLTAATSILALLLQLFVTGRLIERFGVKRVNLVYPCTSILAYGGMLLSSGMLPAIWASVNKDALMPAIRMPVRSLFFNVLPDYVQGRSRALALVIVMPLALALTGGMLVYLQQLDHPEVFLFAGLVASGAYLVFNTRMNRAYMGAILTTLRERVFIPDGETGLRSINPEQLLDELVHAFRQSSGESRATFARMLIEEYPEHGAREILRAMADEENATRDALVQLLDRFQPDLVLTCYRQLPEDADPHLRATVLRLLYDKRLPELLETVAVALASANYRMCATGIHGVLQYGIEDMSQAARDNWQKLLCHHDAEANVAGLELFDYHEEPGLEPEVHRLFDHDAPAVQLACLHLLSQGRLAPPPGLDGQLARLAGSLDIGVRRLAVSCARWLPVELRQAMAWRALEDGHPKVRAPALQLLLDEEDAGVEHVIPHLTETGGSPRAVQALLAALSRRTVPRSLFERIALARAYFAEDLRHAIEAWDHHQGHDAKDEQAPSLIRIVLEERMKWSANLALTAWSQFRQQDQLAAIQAGLNSGDRRQYANAREALSNLSDSECIRVIERVFQENYRQGERQRKLAEHFATVGGLLQWCCRLPDPWIRECAGQELEQRGLA